MATTEATMRRGLAAVLDTIGEWMVRAAGKLFDASYHLDPSRFDHLNLRSPWPPDETTQE